VTFRENNPDNSQPSRSNRVEPAEENLLRGDEDTDSSPQTGRMTTIGQDNSQVNLSIRFVFKDSVDESAWPVDAGITIEHEKGGMQARWLNDADSLKLLRLKPGDDNTIEIWQAPDLIPESRLGILPAANWIDRQDSFYGKLRETESLRRLVVRNSQGQVFLIPAQTVQFFTGEDLRASEQRPLSS
jgi:hypothetical protein